MVKKTLRKTRGFADYLGRFRAACSCVQKRIRHGKIFSGRYLSAHIAVAHCPLRTRKQPMQKVLAPAIVRQIQTALDQGRLVVISPPGRAATPAPLQRDQVVLAAALCLVFGLQRREGEILAELTTHDYRTKEELHRAATH